MEVSEERVKIQRMLVEIDKKMSEEVGTRRVPRLRVQDRGFPWVMWILAALCFAWWQFGAQFFPQINKPIYFKGGFYVGLLGAALAAIKTLLWLWNGVASKFRPKANTSEDDNERLRELRAERTQLMKRLDELKKL